ncbi:hypothetical protein ACSQ76_08370 [Roseovarius sp. B08]|uniref:hypothetical protein n=1 Tax=Roseovarius sp. B08 TaxID=3449223 RepID=UPI003EDBAE5B
MSEENSDGSETYAILCGECRKGVESRDAEDGQVEYGCSDCNNWDTREEVLRISKEYTTEQAQLNLNKHMKQIASRSKGMTFSGSTTSDKKFRFVVDSPF